MAKIYRVGIKIWSPELNMWIIYYYDVKASSSIFAIAKAVKQARRDMPGEQVGWHSCQKIGKAK